SPTPEPPTMKTVERSLDRDTVVGKMGDLITTAASRHWTEEKHKQLGEELAEEMVVVLPADMKLLLRVFAGMTKNEQIGKWVDECREDKSTIRWTE
ncbi:hypothetical protein M431DRAFT_64996, partial [Trichoderma harzianum CBS 226.95]